MTATSKGVSAPGKTASFTGRLHDHLSKFSAAPFLFVGAGLSRRYLGLEGWEDLLKRFAALTGKPYEYFRSSAGRDLPRVATLIAAALREIWWSDPAYEKSRQAFAKTAGSPESPLKIEVAQYVASKNVSKDAEVAHELELLRGAVVDGVITTNWDRLLEDVFPEFKVYVGQSELLFSISQGIAEIYKIHGSCSAPDSLVLTEGDYREFEDKNPYLAAKLLAVFVEHPVVFLGYSLSDSNVLQILTSVLACLSDAQVEKLKDRLIFVEWNPADEEPTITDSVISRGAGRVLPVTLVRAHSFAPVFEALGMVSRKFPAKLLRRLKEHVYELVKKNDPDNRLFVADIDEETDVSRVDVVLGVGAIQDLVEAKYIGMTDDQLFDDVLSMKAELDHKLLLEKVLPDKCRRKREGKEYLPVFKYLRAAGRITATGPDVSALDARVAEVAKAPYAAGNALERWLPPKDYRGHAARVLACGSVLEVEKQLGAGLAVIVLPLLGAEKISVLELRDFLTRNRAPLYQKGHALQQSAYRKLVCIYDYLAYGRNPAATASAATSAKPGTGAKPVAVKPVPPKPTKG